MSAVLDIAEKLLEELQCETVFEIPVFGGIPVSESILVSWIIMAVVVFACLLLVRNLEVESPGKKQMALEAVVTGLTNMIEGILGEEGKDYVVYICCVLLYIGLSNVIGLFGFKPPTKDVNVTAALAIMSILLITLAGIRKKGILGWLKSFLEPVAVVLPINILELFIRPLSLCMRLFGNVLGAFVVMELLKTVCPVFIPVPFSLYFDIFDGLIQAYVFVFLTSLFVKEAVE
ncbi:MAG: F0F1 ATP synthase subunit A [Lachnospiraceae bacterium]|nr:F0F1 ATP synthase subunit A [Lachnospiraceae bacterium]